MNVTVAGTPVTYQPDDEQLAVVNIELSAIDGEVAYSQVPLPDPSASLSVVTGRSVLVEEIGTTLLDGYIVDFDRDRGPQPVGTNIVKTVSVEDPNAVLTGFRINRIRQREMDYQRVLAFYNLDSAEGDKFGGANIVDTSWILQTNGVRMGRKHYKGDGGWADLIADLVETTGKTLFVHDKAGGGRCVHYHRLTEGHTSTLTITDLVVQDDATTFYPSQPQRNRTAIDLVNDVRAEDSKGRTVYRTDPTSQTAHDADGRLHEAFATFDTDDLEDLENKAAAFLATRKDDTDTYNVTIGPLDATALSKIRVGDLITVTSTVLELTASTRRIAHMTLTVFTGEEGRPAPGLWDARLELGAPVRVGGRGGGGSPITNTPTPAEPYVPPTPTPSGIAAQAILHVADNDPDLDATYLYPSGSPAGRVVEGRQYKFSIDVVTNRKIPNTSEDPDVYWDRAFESASFYVVAADVAHTPVIDFIDPVGPGMELNVSSALSPGYAYWGTGSHIESPWYTYDSPTTDIDLVFFAHTNSIFGGEANWRVTLYERTVDQAPPTTGGEPLGGQQVNAEVGPLGDGETTTGRTAFSYLTSSLRVHVNGLDWTQLITSANPSTGDYTLAYAPSLGSTVTRYYQRGSTVSSGDDGTGSGTGTPPATDPGPATSPELPDTPVDDAAVGSAGALAALNAAATDGQVISVPRRHYNEAFTIDTPNTTWLFNGSTIDGQSTRPTWITVAANGVTIQDLLCQNADPDTSSAEKSPQTGSLSCVGYNNLTLRNVHLRAGRDAGLYLQRSANTTIVACSSNDNPRSGASIGNTPGLRILDSQFNDNLTDATYSPLWEGGGYKIGGSGATNILIERTECSGNAGVGHWIDEHPSNVVIRDCWGHHNGYSGLMYEIATGGSIIRWRGWENGWDDARGDDPGSGDWGWGADVLISSAGQVTRTDCVSAWSSAGHTIINQGDRSNRENTIRLTGSGNVIACDDDRRVASYHQDGSGNQILTTDASNNETGLQWFCASGEIFSWDGNVSAAVFATTRGGIGLDELTGPEIIAILGAIDIGGVAGVGMPTAGTH